LAEALDRAQSKGQIQWRCNQQNPETGDWRTGEFNIVHLPSGQFNLYGSDISHILNLQEAAEAANEAKSRFLSVMSHEIRTPLNAILGLTDLLIHENPTREEQLRHLAYMEFSGRHLLNLVNDILDLEKMASGKATILCSAFDLHVLLKNIIDSFRNRADKVGLALHLQIDPAVPREVHSDVKWLTQILNNLIGNAIKYTEEGSVLVEVKPCKTVAKGPAIIRFSVLDTGRGIPKSEQERILQPFEQIRDTSHIEGTGLGLAIVQKIVQRMSGQLQVKSAIGEGSTFSVDLPMAESKHAAGHTEIGTLQSGHSAPTGTADAASSGSEKSSEKSNDTTPKPGCRILLADDNELNRFVASKLLSRWGYEITQAVNGKEAIDAWEMDNSCLILMDVQMPIMDGIEATDWIRKKEKEMGLSHTPILALTADAEEQTYKRILAAGMDDRIVKPFDPAALRILIERMTSQMSTEA
jgi:signal transduction histidine kinase/CheY-like chemotaxis protein